MTKYYILDENNNPKEEPDLLTWGKWYEGKQRFFKHDKVGETLVSTIFLGLDHNFLGIGKPILWETMIFGGKLDGHQERYSSKESAMKGHEKLVKRVKKCDS